MKGIIFGIGMLLLGIAIFSITILTIGIAEILDVFKTVSVVHVFVYVSISLITMSLAAARWKLILSALNHKLRFIDLFQYNIIGFSISYITPVGRSGGAPARMILLSRHKVPLEKGLASVLIDNIVENSIDILFAITLLSFFFLGIPIEFPNGPLVIPANLRLIVLLGSAIILAAMAIFYYRMLTGKGVFFTILRLTRLSRLPLFAWSEKKLHDLDKTFSWFMRTRPKELFVIFIISCLTWTILLLQYRIALQALGYEMKIFELLMILGVLGVVSVMPVPAGLGVLEFGQAGIFFLLGFDPKLGIAFALLVRLRDFFLTSLGSIFLLQIGFGSLAKMYIKKT